MSTRSGKRIHNSFHENESKPNLVHFANSERKTRSKRLKENIEVVSGSALKNKKQINYVSYHPLDEEDLCTDTVSIKVDETKHTRISRKNALKEINLVTSTESTDTKLEIQKPSRTTRSARKFAEEFVDVYDDKAIEEVKKLKKGKKKKQPHENNAEEVLNKKKTKKKMGKKSGSIVIEDVDPDKAKKMSLNQSSTSIDSFHSADSSPVRKENNVAINLLINSQKDSEYQDVSSSENGMETDTKISGHRKTRSITRLSNVNSAPANTLSEVIKESRKRKFVDDSQDIHFKDTSLNKESLDNSYKQSKKHNSNMNKIVTEEQNINTTFDKEKDTSDLKIVNERNSINNITIEGIKAPEIINTTYDKDELVTEKSTDKMNSALESELIEINTPSKNSSISVSKRKSVINTTFEKTLNDSSILPTTDKCSQSSSLIINTTFEKQSDNIVVSQTRSSIKNTTFDKEIPLENNDLDTKSENKSELSPSKKLSTELNSTYDKSDKSNTTFDKDKQLNITFDQNSKTSLISSDNTSNITLDKLDSSRISITSDESRENIVNTTPVIIDSSIDESIVHSNRHSSNLQPMTPLKREGTFTKDVEVASPKQNESQTPKKRMSLPSPGCTPFHTNKSGSKDKILNVTRSIEKSRRSSIAELINRTTKVMFCSPINNPDIVVQQTKKVIKSNLKGSNKSFIYEESVGPAPRAAPRKRSYTQSDADDSRVKRKRLGDELQNSVNRLSRPRTSSSSAKLFEPGTASKKPVTPKKPDAKVPRTKLPNFAALHQKQFDKMESLGECQERKAKRAKQLLTPTGAITVLERSISPKDNTEPEKSPTTEPQKQKKSKRNPETPVKSLPTLKSLNPGYTRFGFKLNLDVNPFSIPKRNDTKNDSVFNFSTKKQNKAKTSLFSFSSKKDVDSKVLKREATLPSMAGTTSARREVAKQVVMREKSFTDKRSLNRNENRTVIKGVRTNRRFDLQMRMRNID